MLAANTRSVPALDRAFTILELLAQSRAGLTLREIVFETELSKSTVHYLLVTLQRRGYLHRNRKTRRYMFGLKLFSLSNMALISMELRDRALPLLRTLALKTRMTTHMAILEQREAVLVSKIDPLGRSRLATWIGKRMDVHCTSLGKALLAYLPEDEVDLIVREHGLPRHNENTLCSRERLKRDLASTALRGYAVDDEEDELGLRCIGAPVFSHDGAVVASISLAGTTSQITAENLSRLARLVVDTGRSLSKSLGGFAAPRPGATDQPPARDDRSRASRAAAPTWGAERQAILAGGKRTLDGTSAHAGSI